jgi:hypothetical protein
MQEFCQCYARNPDERLRELERQAHATGSPQDWDQYLAALERTGLLDARLASVEATLPPMGGEVTAEDAMFLMRVMGFRYRHGPDLWRGEFISNLRDWGTENIRQAILRKTKSASSKMSETLEGYYWIRYSVRDWTALGYAQGPHIAKTACKCSMDRLITTGCQFFPDLHWPQQLYPIRVISSEAAKQRNYFHRIFLLCPVCQQEVPVGRLDQHMNARSHAGLPARLSMRAGQRRRIWSDDTSGAGPAP